MARRTQEAGTEEIHMEGKRYLPRPVPGGSDHIESLGRWVDNLMGDARIRRRVKEELEPLFLNEDEMPDDPPPSEPPPPVPDGAEEIIEGDKPGKG